MFIEVKIPYEPGNLALAYNRAMETAKSDWVLLLDHDVFIACNKNWYDILLEVVNRVDEKAGLITCVCYKVAGKNPPQKAEIYLNSYDIRNHIKIANYLFRKYGIQLVELDTHKIAGMFMLVNKKAWQKVKFRNVRNDIYFIDWDFCKRLREAGYKIYLLPGLYVFHARRSRDAE